MSRKVGYDVAEVAAMLGVSKYTVRAWIKKGLLGATKTPGGGAWRISKESMKEYAEERYGEHDA